MKIDTSHLNAAQLQTTAATGKTVHSVKTAGTESSTMVQLSTQLQAVEASAASAGVFDAQKVQDIKAAIAEGRFQIHAENIADGLLATVKELIRHHNSTT